MGSFFLPGQEIVYAKLYTDQGEFSVTPETFDYHYNENANLNFKDDLEVLAYIRLQQPFLSRGSQLKVYMLDKKGRKELDSRGAQKYVLTSLIQDIQVSPDEISYLTKNSKYVVQYTHIDLEKILADGPEKGVNAHRLGEIPNFPYK